MVDDIEQCRETTVMEEATFLMRPETLQRRCTIVLIRRTFSLEIVDTYFSGSVHVPTRFGEQRGHMANSALGLSVEYRFPPICRAIKPSVRGSWRRNAELIKVKSGKLWRNQVGCVPHV